MKITVNGAGATVHIHPEPVKDVTIDAPTLTDLPKPIGILQDRKPEPGDRAFHFVKVAPSSVAGPPEASVMREWKSAFEEPLTGTPGAPGTIERRGPSGPLPDTFGISGTVTPPPTPETPTAPRRPPVVHPEIPATMRRWTHGGLSAFMVTHGDMVTLTVPSETMAALAKGFDNMVDAAYGPEKVAEDTLAETIAEEYRVRPDAVQQAISVSKHVINTYVG